MIRCGPGESPGPVAERPSGSEIWACQETIDAQLGDARRNLRLARIVTTLAEHPESSIPEAMGDWGQLKATYRFFDNPNCDPQEILAAHRRSTLRRIVGRDLILIAEDTTQFDFSTHHAAQGMGPTGAKGLQGFFMHSALGMTVEGIPLGLLGCRTWKRAPEPQEGQPKESARWPEMLTGATADLPPECHTVTICDREADFFEFLSAAARQEQRVLVRASHNRTLVGEAARLWETMATAPSLGRLEVHIPRGDDRAPRRAQLELRSRPVTIPAPAYRGRERLAPVAIVAVLAEEREPPQGEDPVSWMLLTTIPVGTFEQAAQCVVWYTYRWRIERFHYALKSGCGIEKLQLETAARLHTALAVYCLVAWRLLYLTYAAREQPDQPCTLFLTEVEWKALYGRIHRTPHVPADPPDVRTAVRWIAKLGGFLGRKSDGEPGVKVIWRGFRRLMDIADAWAIFRPSN
jgi:hypothetical protein